MQKAFTGVSQGEEEIDVTLWRMKNLVLKWLLMEMPEEQTIFITVNRGKRNWNIPEFLRGGSGRKYALRDFEVLHCMEVVWCTGVFCSAGASVSNLTTMKRFEWSKKENMKIRYFGSCSEGFISVSVKWEELKRKIYELFEDHIETCIKWSSGKDAGEKNVNFGRALYFDKRRWSI